jgi:hypothetical protein
MNERFAPIPVGKVAPAPTHIPAPCASLLEPARSIGSYDGMADMGDHAITRAEASPLLLSTPALIAEVDALAMRIVRRETRARDVLLVQALAARLRTATTMAPRNREPLEGMLRLECPEVA